MKKRRVKTKAELYREKLYKNYKRQKNKELWQYLFGVCIIVFGFLASIVFALLRLLGSQDIKLMRVAFGLISPEVFVIIFGSISGISLFIFLVFLVQKKENFQWFAFHFFRKDFRPSKRWALVYYQQGEFTICKTTKRAPMTSRVIKIKLDTKIDANVLTMERQPGSHRDNGYRASFWVQLGFVEDLTILLMERVFVNVNAFITEAKKIAEQELRKPLQNLGWGSKKVSQGAIEQACKQVQICVKGIPLCIKGSGDPKNVQSSKSYWQPGSQTQQKKEPSSKELDEALSKCYENKKWQ